jgi:hypothetical protein
MGDDAGAITDTTKVGGMLLAAFKAGQTEEIVWTDVNVGDLVITVASDAMKAPLGDRASVRLPVSYAETIEICAALGCVVQDQAMCDAMFGQAKAQLNFVGLVMTAADTELMDSAGFVFKFDDGVQKQLAASPPAPGDLVFGAWKLWILNPVITLRGAVNYGFWDKSKRPPAPIQTVGDMHDPSHYDYSQLLQPVKRMARQANGDAVDLLDYFATQDKVPAKYLDPYRTTPAADA